MLLRIILKIKFGEEGVNSLNCYMITTTEIDYEWDIDNKFKCAGFPDRNKKSLLNMNSGDLIVYYVTKISKFMAVTEVIGDYYYSEEPIWDDPYDLWEHRVPTKPLVYFENFDDGIYIKDIWDNLEFIKNKKKWGSQVQGSFKRLSEHDSKVILKSLKEKKKSL